MQISFDMCHNLSKSFQFLEKHDPKIFKSSRNIMEVGCFEGCSTRYLHKSFSNSNISPKIYCIDTWDDNYEEKSCGAPFSINYNGQYDRFINNTRDIRSSLVIIPGKSELEIPRLQNISNSNLKFDFVYIDGNHTAGSFFYDAKNVFSMVKENGYILFDDYDWGDYKNFPDLTPRKGIDSFLELYGTDIEIVFEGFQKLIRKRKKERI
jgi:hypothetical protein